MMNEANGCCRWRTAVGILTIGLVACSLPAYAAMGPITGGTSGQTEDPPAQVIGDKDLIRWMGNTLDQPFPQGAIRDTGVCEPPIGVEEPVACTTNGDCAGLGPETCTGGFCAYPTPTPCTTNGDCVGLGTGKCDFGTGFCQDQNYHICVPGAVDEGEWNLSSNGCGFPDDQHNGGCNATGGAVFTSIQCGDTVCGTAALEIYSGSQRRDTDWYELVITEDTLVTMAGTAEFDWVMGLGQNHGDDNCAVYNYLFWGGHYIVTDACTSGVADACIHAGTWWIAVVPQWNTPYPCLDYELTVTCETPCQIACCVGNDLCIHTDHDTCEVGGGAPQDATTCGAVDCSYACDTATEFPCNTQQTIDNTINSDIANPPMSCATGDSIGLLWWWFTAEGDSVEISTCNSVVAQGGDSVFALYSGDCVNTLGEIDCSEDQDCAVGGQWLGIICNCTLIPGDTYWIQFAAWAAGAQGNYLVQIECPCPECAPAACCLSDGSCIIASRADCLAQPGAPGNYQGQGTVCEGDLDSNGIDDACEIGACCTGGTACAPMSFGLCELTGGLDYIPGGSCEPNPCLGACCRKVTFPPPGYWVCTEIADGGCPGSSTWYAGQQCISGEYPWFDCPDDTVCTLQGLPEWNPDVDNPNCQRPVYDNEAVEGNVAIASDANPILDGGEPWTVRVADDFVPTVTGINLVCWWGLYTDLNTNNPAPAPNCYLPIDDFTITFYDDAGSCPGNVVAQYGQSLTAPNDLTVVKTNAGWTAGADDHQVWEYEGTLGSTFNPTINECYWIEIVNNTDDGSGTQSCVWWWSVSLFSEGNGYSVLDESAAPTSGPSGYDCTPNCPSCSTINRWDMAFCLNVPNVPCTLPGCQNWDCQGDAEGETICTNGWQDTVNAGCNVFCYDASNPGCTLGGSSPYFTPIACGQNICGTYGTFEGQPSCWSDEDCDPLETCVGAAGGFNGYCTGDTVNRRDTDWYKIEITSGPQPLHWCVTGQAPTLMGIINTFAADNCPPNLAWAALGVNPACIGTCEYASLATGFWYGYVATTAFTGVPCGTEYEVCLDCGSGCGGAAPCTCTGVRSYKTHGGAAGELYIPMDCGGTAGVESRIGGITKIQMDVDDSSGFAGGVTATCANSGVYGGTATGVIVDADTVEVTFSPALPGPEDTCTITLDCGASACVRIVEGDMNMNGSTEITDSLQVKIRFGLALDNTNASWDFNGSGAIEITDSLQVKIRFGFTAPACP